MALHTELPIFARAYELLSLTIDVVGNMPRNIKPVVGKQLTEDCLAIADLIRGANVAQGAAKAEPLAKLVAQLQQVELLLRVARDKRFISIDQYAKAIKMTGDIGRQASAWRNKFRPVA